MGNQRKRMATRRAFLNLDRFDVYSTNDRFIKRQGEIDILEGVNDQGTNRATLHTSPGIYPHPLLSSNHGEITTKLLLGCRMPDQRFQTGYLPNFMT